MADEKNAPEQEPASALPWWEGLSDEDIEALGAMLHAMKPREDRKD